MERIRLGRLRGNDLPPARTALLGSGFGPLRAVLLACAFGYLLLHRTAAPQAPADWGPALCSLALGTLGGRLPLTVALGQAALLALAERFGHLPPIGIKIMASTALFEVALRRWGVPALLTASALTTVYLAIGLPGDVPALLYKLAAVVGGPMLLAAYVRSLEQVARSAQERAAEAERATRMSERTAIARELHDMVAHHLASVALRVGVARHVIPRTDPRVTEVLDDVHASASSALADLRRLLTALRDPDDPGRLLAEPADLPVALDGLVDRARRAGLTVEASVTPELAGLDAVRGLTLLRLVQEGLTNIVKHAGRQASVRLDAVMTGDGSVSLEIRNDVPGGLAAAGDRSAAGGAGHGLLGMRERVDLVGGSLEVGPASGGWRLSALLPEPRS
ncbi:sensor histidine kinase [Actinoallomurus rhizosphaericola]|uniref:sensor histidine kinase n=1 Tax=Actinoallomurus rhizosphaericola TaxID=2952536 RepID=UPI002093BDA8|nr:histidine kinase [Actinoallomurus rhizosphaericola]MCO5998142.1 histidine kinase [Actinoallomurus rhizosphaericola]